MKRNLTILISFIFFSLVLTNANGQNVNKSGFSPESLAKKSTNLLIKETKIDSLIAKKVYVFFLDYHKEKNKLTLIDGEDQQLRIEKSLKINLINMKLENQLKTVLTDDQYKNAQSAKNEMLSVTVIRNKK